MWNFMYLCMCGVCGVYVVCVVCMWYVCYLSDHLTLICMRMRERRTISSMKRGEPD